MNLFTTLASEPSIDVQGLPCAEDALAHAVRSYPTESCGAIVIRRGRAFYEPVRNTDPKPGQDATWDPEQLHAIEQTGEVVALVHSHPDFPATPSQTDRVMCELSEVPCFIISVYKDLITGDISVVDVSRTAPDGYKAPLVGRKFHHGVLDCFTLIRDYYAQELSIDLPDFEREDDWWLHGQNLYMDNFKAAGFEVSPGDLQKHDVILMQVRAPVPNHAGVYIGDSKILHHMYGRMSTRDIYGGYLRETTTLILRHRSLK